MKFKGIAKAIGWVAGITAIAVGGYLTYDEFLVKDASGKTKWQKRKSNSAAGDNESGTGRILDDGNGTGEVITTKPAPVLDETEIKPDTNVSYKGWWVKSRSKTPAYAPYKKANDTLDYPSSSKIGSFKANQVIGVVVDENPAWYGDKLLVEMVTGVTYGGVTFKRIFVDKPYVERVSKK